MNSNWSLYTYGENALRQPAASNAFDSICFCAHTIVVPWTIIFHEEFEPEFDELLPDVQDELYAEAAFVERFGAETSRPHVDTLKGSDYPNMKELRFEAADGEWRVAFAFDPKRRAIPLIAGDKTGLSEKKFYRRLIAKADGRYTRHLAKLKAQDSKAGEKKRP